MNKALFPLLLLLLACSAHGGVYKWIDSSGEVHYGDQPPPSNKSQKLNIQTPAAGSQSGGDGKASPAKSMADKELDFRKRQVEKEEAQKKQEKDAALAKQKQENCAQARGNLRNLQEGGRIVKYNDKGEREYLDDAARQQAMSEAQKAADSWCK